VETLSFKKNDNDTETFEDEVLNITIEENVIDKNSYKHKWSAGFSAFFKVVLAELEGVITLAKDNASKLVKLTNRVTVVEGMLSPGGDITGILPIGSVIFHVSPDASDGEWKPLDGVTEIYKWVDQNIGQASGESVIYTMLVDNYDLENGTDADFFKLPDFSNAMPYQQGGALGPAAGEWGGQINKSHLPKHQHDESYGGSLKTTNIGNSGFDGSHSHTVSYSNGVPMSNNSGKYKRPTTGNGSESPDSIKTTVASISGSGAHQHGINGKTGTHSSDWGSNNKFIFEPPRVLGGWLIKVA